ncbi:MAG TPA: chemotaxis protein CheA, partial [Longimicrobiaceae bacterium]|nr:chemotaxis protein CheA [Longimicrobiaceae bacterium]
MDIDFDAIVAVFTDECAENLAVMEDALLALEARGADAERLDVIFRVVHTLKGDAGNLGFPALAGLAHAVEDLLDHLREGRLALSGAHVALLLEAVDALRTAVPAAVAGAADLPPAARSLMARIAAEARDAGGDGETDAGPAWTPAGTAADLPEAEDGAGAGPESVAATAQRTLRVEVRRLDRALDLVGESAVARGRLARMIEEGRPHAELLEAHREADRLHTDLQEVVMKLRMVPLGPTFRPHLRTVRDVAFANGKLARLVIQGEDVEVDTRVVEHLRDPLTHMVRNAVDHGVETPEARRRAGKDPQGVVRLTAEYEGGTIVIRMSDDGAGLSRERIARRARERGLAAEPERLSDAELFRLIFQPGFSTTDAVTDLSGRGVGLDVVRSKVEALRGTLSVESVEGRGTTFTLRLPLTLALIDGFSVGVGGETYVIPLDSVVECLELPATRHDAAAEGVISLRGQPLPFLRMRSFLGAADAAPGRENVVVVRHGGAQAGLVVDALLGESQAVIKPLGRLFDGLPGVAGSTILGSGRVALILDVRAVLDES